ncbi:hypothetical protein PTKIN_Ptkin11bG0093600 [Pterospermum kingtungense]
MYLEDIIKSLTNNTLQFQQKIKPSIQNLNNQMRQIATTASRLEAQSSGKLPSQKMVNPKENVSAMVLRSGKMVENLVKATSEPSKMNKVGNIAVDEDTPINSEASEGKSSSLPEYKLVLHFPQALTESKKYDSYKDFYETFHKCGVNIQLFYVIKEAPHYAKFLKELCTHKRE